MVTLNPNNCPSATLTAALVVMAGWPHRRFTCSDALLYEIVGISSNFEAVAATAAHSARFHKNTPSPTRLSAVAYVGPRDAIPQNVSPRGREGQGGGGDNTNIHAKIAKITRGKRQEKKQAQEKIELLFGRLTRVVYAFVKMDQPIGISIPATRNTPLAALAREASRRSTQLINTLPENLQIRKIAREVTNEGSR